MTRIFKSNRLTQKTTILATIAVLATFTLAGCSQPKAPVARVEPSPTQQASQPERQTTETERRTAQTERPSTQAETATLKNLQAAYNGEANAHVMYLDFAKKADEEGYKEVAALFRAAAKAEAIHRNNHAKVIEEMGATPEHALTMPEVKTTEENLAQAIKGESYERDTMYPQYISEAKTENNEAAVKSLNYALEAETQHARLFTDAKDHLSAWREETHPFYVCNVSGQTFINETDTASCPSVPSGVAYETVR
jgi:rubrerythrin